MLGSIILGKSITSAHRYGNDAETLLKASVMSLFSLLISRVTSTIVRWKNIYFVVERLTKSNGVVKSHNTKVERLFSVVNSPLLSDGTSF